MSMARDERAELVDLLLALAPKQWDAPTLCSEWRVRGVVAHMASYNELNTLGLVGRFLRTGLIPGGANALGVGAYTDRSPDELTALAKNNLQPRGLTAGFGGRIALTDGRSTSRTSAVRSAYLDTYPRSGSPPCSSSPRPRRRSAQPSASAG
jgi:uncharacterized protein (TIGR03083 family)